MFVPFIHVVLFCEMLERLSLGRDSMFGYKSGNGADQFSTPKENITENIAPLQDDRESSSSSSVSGIH